MKHPVIMLLSVATLWAAPAFADVPGPGWITREQVAAVLKKRGYEITKLEADDGHWEGEAVRKGLRYDFHVDPKTSRITKLERDRD